MDLQVNVTFIACLMLGAAGGLESRLVGRKLAIATHMAATSLGYFAVAICHTSIESSFGVSSAPLYALALAFLVCAWISETDSLRSGEGVETRGDASNHVVAFVIGYGGAIGSAAILTLAVVEMFALFMRRTHTGCEPVYGAEAPGAALDEAG